MVAIDDVVAVADLYQFNRRQLASALPGDGYGQPAILRACLHRPKLGVEIVRPATIGAAANRLQRKPVLLHEHRC